VPVTKGNQGGPPIVNPFNHIDGKYCFVSEIEYSDYGRYIVRTDMLVPAYTVSLFNDSLTSMPDPDSKWLLDYYLHALMSENRDSFYEFEYDFIDSWNKAREESISTGRYLFDGDEEWYEEVVMVTTIKTR